MTNEALETHVVKQVEMLAVPRPPRRPRLSRRRRRSCDGATAVRRAARRARRPRADCAEALRAFDGRERTSLTDGADLATREELTLDVPPIGAPARAAS